MSAGDGISVAVAGGHGKIGMHLIRLLAERGDEVRSLDRRAEYADELRAAGARPVLCDLEAAGLPEIGEAIAGADAAVFSVGAGPGSGPEPKWQIDYAGALKLVAAALLRDVRRFVMVSSIGADAGARGKEPFATYLRAKGRADEELERSGLDYTIVRPTMLTDNPATGRILAGRGLGRSEVSREDVAAVLAATLRAPNTIGATFEVAAGTDPVPEAVAAL